MVKDFKRRQALRARSLPYRLQKPDNAGAPAQAQLKSSKLWDSDIYTNTVMSPYLFVLYSRKPNCKKEDKEWVTKSLAESNVSHALYTVGDENPTVKKAWEEAESKGKQLPALMMRGRIIGDFKEVRQWINSGEPNKYIDEGCERAEVYLKTPPLSPNAKVSDMPYIPGFGRNVFNLPIPPWADIPPPIPASELSDL